MDVEKYNNRQLKLDTIIKGIGLLQFIVVFIATLVREKDLLEAVEVIAISFITFYVCNLYEPTMLSETTLFKDGERIETVNPVK